MAIKFIQSDITKLELKTTWASGIVYCKMCLIFGSEDQKNGMIYMVLYGMVWYGMAWYIYDMYTDLKYIMISCQKWKYIFITLCDKFFW